LIFNPPQIFGGLQVASLSQNAQWYSLKSIKPCAEFCNLIGNITLEAISKMQIMFKDKARADEKAESAKVRWRMSSTF
jgi:hypothetical protein